MIEIIVDSTCDLQETLMQEYDIKLLPYRVLLKDKEHYDKVTISTEEVYEYMKQGIVPITSMPSPMDIQNLFTRCCEMGNDFIFLTLSAKLSGTYSLGYTIRQELLEQYPDRKMAVIDTKSGSTAIGLLALQAAKLLRSGKDFESILAHIEELTDCTEHIFMLQDLDWLIKGGRLTRAEGLMGSMLNIKPLLHVKDGSIELLAKIRGRKKALGVLTDILEERMAEFPDQLLGISHTGDLEIVSELMDMIHCRLGEKKIMVNKIGASLASHLGIGGIGIFFFNKKPEHYIE